MIKIEDCGSGFYPVEKDLLEMLAIFIKSRETIMEFDDGSYMIAKSDDEIYISHSFKRITI